MKMRVFKRTLFM